MADKYGVTAVRYNDENTHIDKLKAGLIKDGMLQAQKEFSRTEVVSLVKAKNTFVSLVKKADGSGYSMSAEINVFPVETDYLKTKQDKITKDNLENLPAF